MSKVSLVCGSDESLRLKHAVLLYESDRGAVYATTHPVEADAENPRRPIIGAGTPLTKHSLVKFAQAVDAASAFSGFVPENLLFTGPNLIAWWAPAMIRTAWFKTQSKVIGERSAPVAHPALVFVASSDGFYVFALRDSTRPQLDTPLYHSPHFNVNNVGHLCTGNVKMPAGPSKEAIAQYEDAFYRSHFTHAGAVSAVKYKGGMEALWRDQLERPNVDAMRAALKPTKLNLKTAIERIASNQRNAN